MTIIVLARTRDKENSLEIKILGPGCSKCNKTTNIVKETVTELGIDANIIKVTDMMEIAGIIIAFLALLWAVLTYFIGPPSRRRKRKRVIQRAILIRDRLINIKHAEKNTKQWNDELWYLGEDMQKYNAAIASSDKKIKEKHDPIYQFIKPIHMDHKIGHIDEAVRKIDNALEDAD